MMRISIDFTGGTPTEVAAIGPSTVQCKPVSPYSGAQWFYWCVRVDDLSAGERATIELCWVPIWTAADLPPGATQELIARTVDSDSFATVLPGCIHTSEDLREWHPVDGVTGDGQKTTIPLRGTGRPIYVCTQIPYLPEQLESLLCFARTNEPGCLLQIGQSRAGRPIHVLRLPATERPSAAATIYVQAYQHMAEYSGPHIVDALVRYLLSPAGASVRQRLNWHIMPCFDLDGLHDGQEAVRKLSPGETETQNPNRDWKSGTWPEVRAVLRFLETEVAVGTRYVTALDLHNGWSERAVSGGCYTVFPPDEADEAYIAMQKDLIEVLYRGTDHEPAGTERYYIHSSGGTTFTAVFRAMTGAIATTAEFSRHMWWSRTKECYVPARLDHAHRYARDMATVLANYFAPKTR